MEPIVARLARIEARLEGIEYRLLRLENSIHMLQRWRWAVSVVVAAVAGALGGKLLDIVRMLL